jgi:chromosome segregation ATPase
VSALQQLDDTCNKLKRVEDMHKETSNQLENTKLELSTTYSKLNQTQGMFCLSYKTFHIFLIFLLDKLQATETFLQSNQSKLAEVEKQLHQKQEEYNDTFNKWKATESELATTRQNLSELQGFQSHFSSTLTLFLSNNF